MSDESEQDDLDGLLSTIQFLSPTAAAFLQALDYDYAVLVVRELRAMITYWEAHHVCLDPIQRECVLDSIVYGLGSVICGFSAAVSDMVESMQREHGAGALGQQLPRAPGHG